MKFRSSVRFLFASAIISLCIAATTSAQFFWTAPTVPETSTEPTPDVAQSQPLRLESRIFELINKIRTDHGLKAIVWDEQAATVARVHSADMATRDYFSHIDPDGRSIAERADQIGLTKWRRIGENIAFNCGFEDPAARAVAAWMNSEGHRDNILRKKWKQTGIGVTITPSGRFYFTQVFLKRR